MPVAFSEDLVDQMIQVYQTGVTINDVAARFGKSNRGVAERLRRRGVAIRPCWVGRRRYELDETFFDKIDTEAKAYWLGFLSADGHVSRLCLKVQLQAGDANHLVKLAKDLRSTYPVHVRARRDQPQYPYALLQVTSQKLAGALQRLGLVENKVKRVKPCTEVPEELSRHYWRGLVDGDGTIGLYSNKGLRRQWSLKLLGTPAILSGFLAFVRRLVETRTIIRPVVGTYVVKFVGNLITKPVVQALYGNSAVHLDRKKKLADKLLAGVYE